LFDFFNLFQVTYWLAVLAYLALFIVSILRAVSARRDPANSAGSRPGGDTFRGASLIPEKFRKSGKGVETIPSSGGQERSSMAQFETTKVRPMETAA
jgi:hypothetical protein